MVTIGIPFFNAERTLANAIRSVFAQTCQDWELLLVDDGSADASLEIAKSVRDPRVRVISDGVNRKLAFRLNQIAREAGGDYVARMDADDLMSPMRLEKQFEVLNKYPKIDLVSTHYCSVSDNYVPLATRGYTKDGFGIHELLNTSVLVNGTLLGRKNWFIDNPFDVTLPLAQDSILWLQTFLNKQLRSDNVCILKEPLYFYCYEGSVTAKKKLLGLQLQRQALKQYGKLVFSNGEFFRYYSESLLKTTVINICSRLGLMKYFLRSRTVPMNDALLLSRIQNDIACVLGTKIPGIDE